MTWNWKVQRHSSKRAISSKSKILLRTLVISILCQKLINLWLLLESVLPLRKARSTKLKMSLSHLLSSVHRISSLNIKKCMMSRTTIHLQMMKIIRSLQKSSKMMDGMTSVRTDRQERLVKEKKLNSSIGRRNSKWRQRNSKSQL